MTMTRCAGCGLPVPEWPAGWRFTDQPEAAWCPECKAVVVPLRREKAPAAGR